MNYSTYISLCFSLVPCPIDYSCFSRTEFWFCGASSAPQFIILCLVSVFLHNQELVVQWLSCVWLFATQWTAACQVSLSFTISWSLHKLMFIELVMPSNHLILSPPCPPAPSLSQHQGLFQWVGSSCIRWPKYYSCSVSVRTSNEYLGLISFRIDWFDYTSIK